MRGVDAEPEMINEAAGVRQSGPSLLVPIAWWALCIAVVAPALVIDSVPFAGYDGIFAAGGRYALRIAALGIPLAVSAVCWGLSVLLGHTRFRYTPLLWGLATLVILAGVSTAFALDPRVAVFGFWIDEQGLLVWLLYALVALLGSQLISSRARMEQLAFAVIGTGGLVAAIALLEVAGVRFFGIAADQWMYDRGVSTMMNPDFLGTYLVLPSVLAVGVVSATVRWRRTLAAVLALVMLVSVAYTLTRGAWIGVIAGAAVLACLRWFVGRETAVGAVAGTDRRSWARLTVLLSVIGAGILLVALLGTGPLTSRVGATFESVGDLNSVLSGRLTIWSELAPVVAGRPFFGSGPANMVYAWQPYAGRGTLAAQGSAAILDSAHSVPLDLAVQFGSLFAALAIAGAAWLATRAVVVARRAAEARRDPGARLLVAWMAAGIGLGIALLTGVTVVPILSLVAVLFGVQFAAIARPVTGLRRMPDTVLVILVVVAAMALGTWAAVGGYSAIAGNQATRSVAERARRDLTALRIAPWRQGPAMDLVRVTQQLSGSEQSLVGVTEGQAHVMLLERDGLSALTLYGAGDYQLMVAGSPERALAFADRALALRPVFVPGLMLKGDSLVALGETESGLSHLAQAVELESLSIIEHGWETPWDSYLQALLREAETDSAAAATARGVYARFAERFPNSLLLPSFAEQLEALSP